MSGNPGELTSVVAPSSTTNGASFPNATIAHSTPNTGESYFKTSSSAYQNYGIANSSLVMSYTDPEDVLHFPFSYTNTFNDTWATQFTSGVTFYRTGTSTITADGYGTLIKPAGTYTNVMRIHYVQEYQDSANIGTPYIITYNNDQYLWYKEGTHVQIATVYTLTSSTGGPYTGGSYLADGNGIENSPNLIIVSNLYPNPAADKVTVSFTLTENNEADIRLLNTVGQQVKLIHLADCITGENSIQIGTEQLPEGIYFAQILLNGTITANRRFVIAK